MKESRSTFLIWGLGQKAVAKKEEKDELSAFLLPFEIRRVAFVPIKTQFDLVQTVKHKKRELDEAKHVLGKHSLKHCKDGFGSRTVAF